MNAIEFIKDKQDDVLLQDYTLKDMIWFMENYTTLKLKKYISMEKKSECSTCIHFTYFDLYIKGDYSHSREECKKLQIRFEEDTKVLNCRDYIKDTID